MAVKTFTAGAVLTASDTNTYLNNGGLVYVTSASPAANATINIDNIFTSTYRHYRLVMRMTGSSTQAAYLRFRAAGATLTDNIYSSAFGNSNSSTAMGVQGRADSFSPFPPVYATYPTNVIIDIFNPQVTDYTSFVAQGLLGLGGTDSGLSFYQGANKVTTSIDGIAIVTAAAPTITMTYTVYGYRSA